MPGLRSAPEAITQTMRVPSLDRAGTQRPLLAGFVALLAERAVAARQLVYEAIGSPHLRADIAATWERVASEINAVRTMQIIANAMVRSAVANAAAINAEAPRAALIEVKSTQSRQFHAARRTGLRAMKWLCRLGVTASKLCQARPAALRPSSSAG